MFENGLAPEKDRTSSGARLLRSGPQTQQIEDRGRYQPTEEEGLPTQLSWIMIQERHLSRGLLASHASHQPSLTRAAFFRHCSHLAHARQRQCLREVHQSLYQNLEPKSSPSGRTLPSQGYAIHSRQELLGFFFSGSRVMSQQVFWTWNFQKHFSYESVYASRIPPRRSENRGRGRGSVPISGGCLT